MKAGFCPKRLQKLTDDTIAEMDKIVAVKGGGDHAGLGPGPGIA